MAGKYHGDHKLFFVCFGVLDRLLVSSWCFAFLLLWTRKIPLARLCQILFQSLDSWPERPKSMKTDSRGPPEGGHWFIGKIQAISWDQSQALHGLATMSTHFNIFQSTMMHNTLDLLKMAPKKMLFGRLQRSPDPSKPPVPPESKQSVGLFSLKVGHLCRKWLLQFFPSSCQCILWTGQLN